MSYEDDLIEAFLKTPTAQKLYEALSKICNRTFFLAHYLRVLNTDERRQKLIDYIEKYDIKDSSDVENLTDCIIDGVEPEFE